MTHWLTHSKPTENACDCEGAYAQVVITKAELALDRDELLEVVATKFRNAELALFELLRKDGLTR